MGKRRLFILGAGAPYSVGLPMADKVLGALFTQCCTPFIHIHNRTPHSIFESVCIKLTQTMLTVLKKGKHERVPLDLICETFHKESYTSENYYITELLYLAICETLYYQSCNAYSGYDVFSNTLKKGDCVISFNWDLCLEISLYKSGRNFSCHFKEEAPENNINIIKPHGSIDHLIITQDLNSNISDKECNDLLVENLGAGYFALSPTGEASNNYLFTHKLPPILKVCLA